MRINDLKTSLEQNKQIFEEFINQAQREKNQDSDETPANSVRLSDKTSKKVVESASLSQGKDKR